MVDEEGKCGECLEESIWKRVVEENFGGGGLLGGNVSEREKCEKLEDRLK